MKMPGIRLTAIALANSPALAAEAPTPPDASDLLDQYADTQAKLQSFHEKLLITAVDRAGTQVTPSEIRHDGHRFHRCSPSWGQVGSALPAFTHQKPCHDSKL